MAKWILIGAAVILAAGIVVIWATQVRPEQQHEERVARACWSLALGVTRRDAERHFAAEGVSGLGSAGYPGSAGEIRSFGLRGGAGYSIAAFCSVQFDQDGRTSGVGFTSMHSLSVWGWSLYSRVYEMPVSGIVDDRRFRWSEP